jgi:[phosphatase 2A protein]-leucine-carboxy methyltransferase
VSLGAGSDTRFFRLHRTHPDDVTAALIYHELDFAAVTTRKVAAIMRDETNTLQATIGRDDITAADAETGTFTSKRYHIHSVDLRVLRPHCDLPAPIAASIDPSLPTLLISECCLIYLAPEEADAILLWATEIFKSSVGIIIYEPIGGNDSFGKVMVQNLAARGIVLKTLERYSTLSRQRERLRTLGFTDCCDAADICFVHDKWLNQSERDRIARLELLDEVEEWNMLAKHYCVAWGWRGKGFDLWKGAVPVQPNT